VLIFFTFLVLQNLQAFTLLCKDGTTNMSLMYKLQKQTGHFNKHLHKKISLDKHTSRYECKISYPFLDPFDDTVLASHQKSS
jgi:hypothetical protein